MNQRDDTDQRGGGGGDEGRQAELRGAVVTAAALAGDGEDHTRRQSKMGSAIDVIWKSWDNFDENGTPTADGGVAGGGAAAADTALLARKGRLSPYAASRSPYHPRRPSTTLWDLKDARASLTAPRSPSGTLPGLVPPPGALSSGLGPEFTGIKVYRRRWLMLSIFIFLGITNTFQWVQYSIIANIVQRYYNVTTLLVDLTCMSYLIAYLLFFIPASWFLDRHVSTAQIIRRNHLKIQRIAFSLYLI